MKSLIVIPTYNEEENIRPLLNEICKVLTDVNFSILIVDDSPGDLTIEEAKKSVCNNLFFIKRNAKKGLASAYIEGMQFGINNKYDYIIEFDADFSHNPKYLPQMIKELDNNDVVIGSRNIKGGSVTGWGFLRNLISKGGSIYSKIILSCPINDLTGGFNGWKREILEKIGLKNIISNGYCFQIEMKYRAYLLNAKIKEFPIVFKDRLYGVSKMNKSIFIEALFNILKLRFSERKK